MDPNGRPYFWYLGIEKEPPVNTDAYEVFVNKNISLSPVVMEMMKESNLKELEQFMKD